ncbi:hypothetical protein SLEP1_g21001 [Rubroshorea leprosula]|uniref:Uncharacterized protein n=1 Tax=Rubroshorea leprosula TaxID=152421 RepID=A0AAV5J4F6_9ROSI|nr:hypothetical protein SLEP1_g21001 [Rubroshorea leprosula]
MRVSQNQPITRECQYPTRERPQVRNLVYLLGKAAKVFSIHLSRTKPLKLPNDCSPNMQTPIPDPGSHIQSSIPNMLLRSNEED